MSLLERVVAQSASVTGSGHVLRSIHLGEAYLSAERVSDALKIAADAHSRARAHGERGHEAYALLLLAEVARTERRLADALAHAEAAKQISTELNMAPLRARVVGLFGLAAPPMAVKVVG
jgi:hypothetical protein